MVCPMQLSFYKRYLSKQMLVVLLLGFSSGLPLALSGATLHAWLTVRGESIADIGIFSLVGAPYAYKFLWSPFVDKYIPPFLGRRRGWLLITQLALVLTILALAATGQALSMKYMAVFALIIAFCSASQDIAYDAFRADSLSPDERGLGAALGVEGYRIGMFVSGAIALLIAGAYNWQVAYTAMAGFMLIGILATLWAKEPEITEMAPKTLQQAVILPFKDFLTRKRVWWILAFILLYKFGDAYAGALTNTFLIRKLGFSLKMVGAINKGVGLVAILSGVFLGGLLMTRMGLFYSLMLFGILQAVSNLGYMFLSLVEPQLNFVMATVFIENLCAGMGTAAFVALLMSLCNKSFSATQYALLSSLMATGRIFVGPLAGYMIENVGWASFYFSSLFFSLPGLLLLGYLKSDIVSVDKRAGAAEEEELIPANATQRPAQA